MKKLNIKRRVKENVEEFRTLCGTVGTFLALPFQSVAQVRKHQKVIKNMTPEEYDAYMEKVWEDTINWMKGE